MKKIKDRHKFIFRDGEECSKACYMLRLLHGRLMGNDALLTVEEDTEKVVNVVSFSTKSLFKSGNKRIKRSSFFKKNGSSLTSVDITQDYDDVDGESMRVRPSETSLTSADITQDYDDVDGESMRVRRTSRTSRQIDEMVFHDEVTEVCNPLEGLSDSSEDDD